jgi:hypothetical protein
MLGALAVIGLRRPTQNQLFYIWHEDDDLAEPFIMVGHAFDQQHFSGQSPERMIILVLVVPDSRRDYPVDISAICWATQS